MLSSLRLAFRQFAHAPGFTIIAVLTLALGIGANTAFFSVINNALLRPLPYPNQERIAYLNEFNSGKSGSSMSVSYPNFQDWYKQQDVFSSLAFITFNGTKLKTPERTERVQLGMITSDFFSVLGVQPAQGRMPDASDDVESAAPVAWLTHQTWERYFAASPDLIGKTILIEGRDFAVAGILPASFRFTRNTDIFVNLPPLARQYFYTMRENHSNSFALGLLKPGNTITGAQVQMSAIAQRLRNDYPQANGGIDIRVTPLRENIAGNSRTDLLLLSGAVGLVLLIACVNIANMLLARAFSRTREMAIRTALGATRGQLIQQLLIESFVLALLGGAAGTIIGIWGYDLVGRLVPWQAQTLFGNSSGLDSKVLAFTIGITLLTGLGFGLAPAWQLSHVNPNDALKQTPTVVQTRWGRLHLRDLLVGIQVALAVVLLISASLLIRSLQQIAKVDPGLRPSHVLSMQISTPPASEFQKDPTSVFRFCREVTDLVRNLPGVESAAIGNNLPFTWGSSSTVFFRADQPVPEPGKFPTASNRNITKDYFQTLGIPVLRGRVFDGHEPQPNYPANVPVTPANLGIIFKDTTLQAVISRRMAEQIWPGEDPIGKRFQLGFPNMNLPKVEVIGIVGDVTRHGLENGPTAEFYLSYQQFGLPFDTYLVIRTSADPASIANTVRTALDKAFPSHPLYDVRTMTERIDERISGRKFNLHLYVFFACVALLLAVIGIYGVLAFVVGRQTREIGIRMALGARQTDVLYDVLRRGLILIIPGLLIGSGIAWVVSRFLQSQLYSVTRNDPISYSIAAGLLLLAAIVACLLPARRATKVNPIEALRTE